MSLKKESEGFVVLLVIMVLSLAVALVTQLYNTGTVHVAFDHTMIEQEKARALAWSGIELAKGILTLVPTPTTQENEKKEVSDEVAFIAQVIAYANRWIEFPLKKSVDGIDATIRIAVGGEEGKLDVNAIYDFQQKKFKNEGKQTGDMKLIAQEFFAGIKKATGKDLFASFEKFLQKRDYPLNDVTELLAIEEFRQTFKTNLFYVPPLQDTKEKRPLFLTDLFTVFGGKQQLLGLLLSDSVSGIFDLKRAVAQDIKKREAAVKDYFKKTKQPTVAGLFPLLYGNQLKTLSQQGQWLVGNEFVPSVFSVLSYATVGAVTQKLFVILEKKDMMSAKRGEFIIKRVYWL